MARDKLITIRIEGEKRQAFGELAKSQNTDTASLLYDFISQCLDGGIDISLVTGKGNRLDKLDNQLDTNRLDKLEATTQEIDNRLDTIAKKLNDWIEAFGDRLSDCDRELTNRMISLEHRLNTLSIQLDSQQLGSIDTDSQKDSQQENPDMGTVATVEAAIDTVETADTVETDTEKDESVYKVESVYTVESDSIDEPVQPAIGPVGGDSSHLKNQLSEGTVSNRQGLTNQQLSEKTRVPVSTIEKWKKKIKEGEKVTPKKYPDFFKQWTLNLDDSLWYEVD